jgi:hypothetical protein
MSKGRARKWLKSFNGILTSLAAIMTAAAAILGLLFVHQSNQTNYYISIVQRQNEQIRSLQTHPRTKVVDPPVTASPTVSGGANGGGSQTYLSNSAPTVDGGGVNDGATTIDGQSYPNSVTFGCDGLGSNGQPTEAWDVAGSSTFSATVGVPDNTQDVTGYKAQLAFASQNGTKLATTVTVSLGQPATVSFSISGVTQLDVTCNVVAPSGQQPFGFQVGLGNAATTS